MITYNHERFIAQAVQGVLIQNTAFPYELVIGEDCSSDRTREIVSDIQRQHPSIIRLLLADHNRGAMENFAQTLKACRGQYIALLDGDDYWTDSHKLQAQVDFLDSHPDCTICSHNVRKVDDDGKRKPSLYYLASQRRIFTLTDLLAEGPIPFCSVMVRNGLVGELPGWFQQLSGGDWAFQVLNAQHGNIGYLDEVMGTHRMHDQGVWSRASKIQRLTSQIAAYRAVRPHLDSRYAGAIRAALSRCYLKLSSQYERRGDLRSARRCVAKALAAGVFQSGIDHTDIWARALQLYAPRLRKLARSVRRML